MTSLYSDETIKALEESELLAMKTKVDELNKQIDTLTKLKEEKEKVLERRQNLDRISREIEYLDERLLYIKNLALPKIIEGNSARFALSTILTLEGDQNAFLNDIDVDEIEFEEDGTSDISEVPNDRIRPILAGNLGAYFNAPGGIFLPGNQDLDRYFSALLRG